MAVRNKMTAIRAFTKEAGAIIFGKKDKEVKKLAEFLSYLHKATFYH